MGICAVRFFYKISHSVTGNIYICLSCSSACLAAILEDAVWKFFYLIVSIAVIVVFVAPGMATLTGQFGNVTEVGNATGMGNRTHISNSSMSGPTSIQGAESWSSRGSAQNLALLIVPSACAVREAWRRGLSFFFQDLHRLLSAPLDRYTDLDELNEM
mmetsp:Transcript_53687/g.112023  ORF Transcript_53687/g.112023 Transcript_53687/m.112023 type:complete len:158 (-) Transcript_53687:70-543(-)